MAEATGKREWGDAADDNIIYLKGPDIADPWGEALINQLEERIRELEVSYAAEKARCENLQRTKNVLAGLLSIILVLLVCAVTSL